MKSIKVLSGLIAAAFIASGCGGGSGGGSGTASTAGTGDSPAVDTTAGSTPGTAPNNAPITAGEPVAGVWIGDMTWNDVYHDHPYVWDATHIVMPNGDFYHVFNHYYHYPTETQRNTQGGFLVGKVVTQGGDFRVGTTREFSFINDFPDRPASASGTYTSEGQLNGRITYDPPANGQDLTRYFTTNYSRDYAVPARFSDLRFNNNDFRSIQGVLWTQRAARADNSFKTQMHLVVREDGSLTSRFPDQCQVSGNLDPHPTQRVFEATISLGANCPYPGLTFNGIAYVKTSHSTEGAPTPTENRFYLVGTNQDGGEQRGILFVQILQGQVMPEDGPINR